METIRILLVDSKSSARLLLEKQLLHTHSIKFTISLVGINGAGHLLAGGSDAWDVVLFGEGIPSSGLAHLARLFRSRGFGMPILMLTRESEARVPRALHKAGIDDMLNIADIDTPLFFWTFVSTLKQAQIQRKAEEFDAIKERLQGVHHSLAFITHEINNPLGVIRLALYHLKNPKLAKNKEKAFVKILADNVKKVDAQVAELQEVRRKLGEDTSVLTKMLIPNSVQESC
jgi:signal transduction histidine kinase